MRLHWFAVPALLVVTGCATPTQAPPGTTSSVWTAQPMRVNPANIRRLAGLFPSGYEVSDVAGTASPATYWGLKPGWSSNPPQCTTLADPAGGGSAPEGLSASGTGGTIHTVVAASPSAAGPDPIVVDECSHWSMDSGRTTAIVDRVDGPEIDGVPTVGMVTAIRTIVEGGNEIDARATTSVAYLDEYVVFVTVLIDPGSGPSELSPDLASTLLTEAVAMLRE